MVVVMTNDAKDKLQAVLNHDWSDQGQDLPPGYVAECSTWYEALTQPHRAVATAARLAFEDGKEEDAEKIAAELPPAPRFPL
jgi:hypothetical protein